MPAPSNRRPALRVRLAAGLAGAAAIAALAIPAFAGPAAAAAPGATTVTTVVASDGSTAISGSASSKLQPTGRRW
jgi:hypothetical protein